jgi:beta-glucosidase
MSREHLSYRFGLLALFLSLTFYANYLWSQNSNAVLDDPGIETRVDALLQQMTLEEKVGQLVQRVAPWGATGPGAGGAGWEKVAAQGEVGSLFGLTDPATINALQKAAVEKSRLHIPVLFGLDVIHGFRTTFPVPLGMAATWDPSLVERASRIAAQEASASGIRWTFSPMVDIARDARWGRIVEGAGEDPYLGAVMARAYVRGYQGERLDAPDSLAACAKHYVAYGAAEGGRDYNTVDMSERTLRQVYLPPFKAAVEAGAATLMSAFNSLNGVPASANAFTLKQVLKGEWKFRGFVVSDYTSIAELVPHGIANDGPTAARKAFLAGVDMDMVDGLYTNLVQSVRSGAVAEAAVDDAVRRILRVKFGLGLFDRPYTKEVPPSAAIPTEYREAARTAAEESFVLLKNAPAANGVPALPISEKVHTLALIGPLAGDASDMLGPWSTGRSSPKDVVTLRAALAERSGKSGIKLLYSLGTEIWGKSESGFAEALDAAKQADLVLLALGEDDWSSAEAGSRAHLGLPGNQQQLLEAVAATGKPVVLILFSGRPLALTAAVPHVSALLEAWFPGVEAGPALVRTFFGEVNPSGKLTVSFPRAEGQEPLYYNAFNTGRPPEGIDLSHRPRNPDERFHSRYIDELNAPLFPFGYGLSYSRFTYSPLTLSTSALGARALNQGNAAPLRVSAEVRNVGDRSGDEVVQLYIRERGTSVVRPARELKGFQRLTLAPGESKRVEFALGRDELAFWNIDMKEVVEPAAVSVWIGPNSGEGSQAQFDISE